MRQPIYDIDQLILLLLNKFSLIFKNELFGKSTESGIQYYYQFYLFGKLLFQ